MAVLVTVQDGLSSRLTPFRFYVLALATWILYGAALAIYRLYFSPISHIPGPKLAAMTQYYESYYDLIAGGGGNFTRQIKKLHDEYGTVHQSPHCQNRFNIFQVQSSVLTPSRFISMIQSIMKPSMLHQHHIASQSFSRIDSTYLRQRFRQQTTLCTSRAEQR